MEDHRSYLNVKIIEEEYGIKPDHVKQAIQNGKILSIKIGREILVKRKDLEHWFDQMLMNEKMLRKAAEKEKGGGREHTGV